eukprot:3078509-Prymnesium_polylepis.1
MSRTPPIARPHVHVSHTSIVVRVGVTCVRGRVRSHRRVLAHPIAVLLEGHVAAVVRVSLVENVVHEVLDGLRVVLEPVRAHRGADKCVWHTPWVGRAAKGNRSALGRAPQEQGTTHTGDARRIGLVRLLRKPWVVAMGACREAMWPRCAGIACGAASRACGTCHAPSACRSRRPHGRRGQRAAGHRCERESEQSA